MFQCEYTGNYFYKNMFMFFDGCADGYHYFSGPLRPFIPPQLYHVFPSFHQQYEFINVDFRYPPTIFSRSNFTGPIDLPSEPAPPVPSFVPSPDPTPDPCLASPAPDAPTPDNPHDLLAPDPTDKDLGHEVVYNGTEFEDEKILPTTSRQYHEYLLRTNNFLHQPAQPNKNIVPTSKPDPPSDPKYPSPPPSKTPTTMPSKIPCPPKLPSDPIACD